jgi:photosystem II oxygen-evolving enhancer protein 3
MQRWKKQETGRRDALASIAAAGAAVVPAVANAASGESPKFSVFGLIGDGTTYSEGAAYGSDQSTKVYSPYSVYGEAGPDSLYKASNDEYLSRKKAILAETRNRLQKIPKYAERKEWFNVRDELTRYMYETRGAVRSLASTTTQKEKADAFFKAIEDVYLQAGFKSQDKVLAAGAKSIEALDDFVNSI